MSRLFNGSSDKLRVGAANGTSPISFTAWIYPTSVTGTHYVAIHGDSAVDTMLYALYLSGATLVANHYDGDNQTSTKTTVSINTWHHVAAVFASASSRTVYLDGVAGTENTTTQTAGTASDYIAAGVLEWPGGDLFHFAGRIAEWALYGKALSAAEVLQLSKDFAPSLVQPNSLNIYMPLLGVQSTPRDLINGPVWSLTGTTKAAHPRIFYPAGPIYSTSPKEPTTIALTTPSWVWVAQALNIKADSSVALTAPSFNWSAQALNINAATLVALTAAAWSWSAKALNIKVDTLIALTAASWTWAAQALSIKADTLIALTAPAWKWAAQAITVLTGTTVTLTAATWGWAAQAITLKTDTLVALTASSWNWAAQALTVTAGGAASLIRNLTQNLTRGLTRVLAKTTDDE